MKTKIIKACTNIFSIMSTVLGINLLLILSSFIEISLWVKILITVIFAANVCFMSFHIEEVNDGSEENILSSWKKDKSE